MNNNNIKITTIVDLIESNNLVYPGRDAIVFGAKKITYGDFSRYCLSLAANLSVLGVKPADRVAVWLPNCPEFIISFFAILKAGGIVVPVNAMLTKEEAKFIIEDCRAKILITCIDKLSDAKNILFRLDSLEKIISVNKEVNDTDTIDFESLTGPAFRPEPGFFPKESDIAQIIYTSGTTGRPKGACLTHKNILSNTRDCLKAVKVTGKDCFICVLPLFHSFSSTICMILPMLAGAKIVVMRSFRPMRRLIRAVLKNRVTVFIAVPGMFKLITQAKLAFWSLLAAKFFSPVRLCVSGAAALPAEVLEKFQKRFRRPLLEGYGLTEASPVVSMNPLRGKRIPGSVGLPLDSVKVKVVDKNGHDLERGATGELLVYGPNVMKGYYNLDVDTKNSIKDGWLHTGDMAKIDDRGYIYIVGRIKEMINVAGLNVYPREIEDLLYRDSRIKEAAVVKVAHHLKGEAPVVFIAGDGRISEKEIIIFLRKNLAPYKIPLRVFFKDILPKNSLGKVLKIELEKEAQTLLRQSFS